MEVVRGAVPDWAGGLDGYGYVYGYGDGGGYSDGSYGHGYGDGGGYSDGSYVYGGGFGYGYGDGDGGYGDGYGDGDGGGFGNNVGYWRAVIEAAPEAVAARARGATEIAFWKSDDGGRPCNGGRPESGVWCAAPGVTEEVRGPLELCGHRALHATRDPARWEGERLWIVALYGEVIEDGDKLGALKREILAECTWWRR